MDRGLIDSFEIKFKSAFRNLKSATLASALLFALSSVVALRLALAVSAEAQQPKKMAKIGALFPGNPTATAHLFDAFSQGLREHGYVDGKNFVLELRYGEARAERISEAARELVSLKVDVIVTATDIAIAAVKRQTSIIPIVMANSTDPVEAGFVQSLARPGGNVTGHSTISPELSGKRLELLMEAVPGLSRVAFLWNPDIRGALFDYQETEGVGRSLGLQVQSVEVRRAEDFDRGFSAVTRGAGAGVDCACSESRSIHKSGPDRQLRAEESAAVYVRTEGVRGRWRAHVLWAEPGRLVAAGCNVCR